MSARFETSNERRFQIAQPKELRITFGLTGRKADLGL